MDAKTLLRELGFSDYEARAYVGLVEAGSCNGYEVAKTTGMPRANVYGVLGRLVERGAAHRADTPDGVRYTAVEPAAVVRQMGEQHRRTLGAAHDALAALERRTDASPVVNLTGYQPLIDRARELIDSSDTSLRIAIQPAEARLLAPCLRDARERDVQITTLCMESCQAECGGCQGHIHRFDMAPGDGARWLIIVTGKGRMLAGEITSQDATAITTERRLVARLADAYICQSIALETLANNASGAFEGLLSRHANQALRAFQSDWKLIGQS